MDKAIELLRELAGKLGQTVESLWPELVAYHAYDALFAIVGWFAAMVFAWSFTFLFFRNTSWWYACKNGENWLSLKAVSLVIAIVTTLGFFGSVSMNLPVVSNPTGYAVSKIIKGGDK